MSTTDSLPSVTARDGDTPQGFALAVTAYLLWGFLPLYLKLVSHVPAAEVVAHRVIWSVPIAAVVLIALRRTATVMEALRTPRMLGMAMVTAALISMNWGVYVWAIATGRVLDAAIGYYINPLFSVFLGAVVLGERLTRPQLVAIVLAFIAVLVLVIDTERMPWAAFGLMFSWGFYALAKKSLPIGPNQGFLLELLILLLPALGYVAYLAANGQSNFNLETTSNTWLLMGCGLVTAVPLLFYANGAKQLRLSTIAILQYIAPTMIFLCAVVIFSEDMGRARMIAFPIIWLAVIIYVTATLRSMKTLT